MDNLEFAKAMIRYEELFKEMKQLEAIIETHVMERGETQAIGNVYAKFTNGRTIYDYETPGRQAPEVVIEKYTEIIEKTDWRSICKEMDFEAPIKKHPVPSVKIDVKLD
jgi:hypothetical protein